MRDLEDPTKHFIIQKLMAGAYRLRPSIDMRLPITAPLLHRLLQATEATMSIFNRTLFQAMFSFAFYTYARIGELAVASKLNADNVLQIKDITVLRKGTTPVEIKVAFRKFKHNLTGRPHLVAFKANQTKFCPVQLLLRYLQIRGQWSSNLFITAGNKPISRAFFDAQLKICLNFCHLDTRAYKGHSFRIGAASWDAQNRVPDSQIRLKGRWKSDAFRKYIRVITN